MYIEQLVYVASINVDASQENIVCTRAYIEMQTASLTRSVIVQIVHKMLTNYDLAPWTAGTKNGWKQKRIHMA